MAFSFRARLFITYTLVLLVALAVFVGLATHEQRRWIVERKVSRDDQISRSGETWKPLGEIAELSSFFQVVDAATAAEGATRQGAVATTAALNTAPALRRAVAHEPAVATVSGSRSPPPASVSSAS